MNIGFGSIDIACNPQDQRFYIATQPDSSIYVIRDEIPWIEEANTLDAISLTPEIYPNPARSFLAVRLPQTADRKSIKIFDAAGKLIKEIEILRGVYPASFEKRDCFASARNDKRCGAQNDGAGDTEISLKGINPGIYFLRLGKETKKFLVVE